MNKEKLLLFIWGCLTVVLVSLYAVSGFLNTVKIFKLSGGTTINLDMAGIGEIALICAVYYLSKYILEGEK